MKRKKKEMSLLEGECLTSCNLLVVESRLKVRSADSWATAHFVTVRSKLVFLLKDPSENCKQVRTLKKKKNLALNTPIPFFRGFLDYLTS